MQSDSPSYLTGAVFGLTAASIWAGWSAMTRLAVTTNLDAWHIPALRFGVAGLLLSPILIRRGLALDRLGWPGLAGIIIGQGAPYVLIAALGLRFAPAADLGALSAAFRRLASRDDCRGKTVDYAKIRPLADIGRRFDHDRRARLSLERFSQLW